MLCREGCEETGKPTRRPAAREAEGMELGGRVRASWRWSGQDVIGAVRARATALSATSSMGQLNRQVIMKDRGRTVIQCGHTGKRSRGPVSGYIVSRPNPPSGPDMKFRFKRRQEECMGKRSQQGVVLPATPLSQSQFQSLQQGSLTAVRIM